MEVFFTGSFEERKRQFFKKPIQKCAKYIGQPYMARKRKLFSGGLAGSVLGSGGGGHKQPGSGAFRGQSKLYRTRIVRVLTLIT